MKIIDKILFFISGIKLKRKVKKMIAAQNKDLSEKDEEVSVSFDSDNIYDYTSYEKIKSWSKSYLSLVRKIALNLVGDLTEADISKLADYCPNLNLLEILDRKKGDNEDISVDLSSLKQVKKIYLSLSRNNTKIKFPPNLQELNISMGNYSDNLNDLPSSLQRININIRIEKSIEEIRDYIQSLQGLKGNFSIYLNVVEHNHLNCLIDEFDITDFMQDPECDIMEKIRAEIQRKKDEEEKKELDRKKKLLEKEQESIHAKIYRSFREGTNINLSSETSNFINECFPSNTEDVVYTESNLLDYKRITGEDGIVTKESIQYRKQYLAEMYDKGIQKGISIPFSIFMEFIKHEELVDLLSPLRDIMIIPDASDSQNVQQETHSPNDKIRNINMMLGSKDFEEFLKKTNGQHVIYIDMPHILDIDYDLLKKYSGLKVKVEKDDVYFVDEYIGVCHFFNEVINNVR